MTIKLQLGIFTEYWPGLFSTDTLNPDSDGLH